MAGKEVRLIKVNTVKYLQFSTWKGLMMIHMNRAKRKMYITEPRPRCWSREAPSSSQ
jgi:hypothetical protein